MKTRLIALVCFFCGVAGTVASADDAVKLTVKKIVETRVSGTAPSGSESAPRSTNPNDVAKLAITVEASGAVLSQATKYGYVQVTATDDRGQTLKAPQDMGVMTHPIDEYRNIDRDSMYFWEEEKPQDRIQFDLVLETSARSAAHIASLDVAFKLLTVAEQKEIVIDSIAQKTGQTLDDATLQAAGLQIAVGKPSDDDANAVQLAISGNHDALVEMALTDKEGKPLQASSITWSMGDRKELTLQTWEKLPADARLLVTVGIGQETVEVASKLENLKLP